MISDRVEKSAGSRKPAFRRSVPQVQSGRSASRLRRGRTHAIRGWVSSGAFLCRLQTVPKTPIPGRPPARRARARSARPDPCATGRRLALLICLIVLTPFSSEFGESLTNRLCWPCDRKQRCSSSEARVDFPKQRLDRRFELFLRRRREWERDGVIRIGFLAFMRCR
jgi:hypothetical protein